MIFGRRYLNICHGYDKEIARVQSQWGRCQASKGITYPKPSKKIQKRYEKKKNSVRDYLHKVTHAVAVYCEEHDIHTEVCDKEQPCEERTVSNGREDISCGCGWSIQYPEEVFCRKWNKEGTARNRAGSDRGHKSSSKGVMDAPGTCMA